MKKSEAKRNKIADTLADFVLSHGLPGASLRPLAAAAETSDRMLLYYFKDKEDIIATVLGRIAKRLADRLLALERPALRATFEVEDDLLGLTTSGDLWPFMCVWLEIASLAARGDPLFRAIGGQIAVGFRDHIAGMLAIKDDMTRTAAAVSILRVVEGAIILKAIGFDKPA